MTNDFPNNVYQVRSATGRVSILFFNRFIRSRLVGNLENDGTFEADSEGGPAGLRQSSISQND